MSSIPEDVIKAILCRLPVKSLLRFRCVSKQFRSIIDGSDFIKLHLQSCSSDQRLIVQDTPSTLFSMDLDSTDNAFKLGLPFESWGSDFSVIGSCNGLLALSHLHSSIGLWNISTRKHQILPKFWGNFDGYYDFFDGFGYDVATDDYKWVRVIFDRINITEVTVYSLKANTWRRIEDFPPYHNYTVHQIGVPVGITLNWLVGVIDIDEFRVMSFDLKSEKFLEVSLPDIVDEAEDEFHVGVLGGCLCLSYFYRRELAIDIWVMKEYGVKESWTKLFSFAEEQLHRGMDFPLGATALGFSKCCDKVLFYEVNGKLFWHNLEKETDEIVEINGRPTSISHATIYVDSLVSI